MVDGFGGGDADCLGVGVGGDEGGFDVLVDDGKNLAGEGMDEVASVGEAGSDDAGFVFGEAQRQGHDVDSRCGTGGEGGVDREAGLDEARGVEGGGGIAGAGHDGEHAIDGAAVGGLAAVHHRGEPNPELAEGVPTTQDHIARGESDGETADQDTEAVLAGGALGDGYAGGGDAVDVSQVGQETQGADGFGLVEEAVGSVFGQDAAAVLPDERERREVVGPESPLAAAAVGGGGDGELDGGFEELVPVPTRQRRGLQANVVEKLGLVPESAGVMPQALAQRLPSIEVA